MKNLDSKLKNRKINKKQLIKYGFQKEKEIYRYKEKIRKQPI